MRSIALAVALTAAVLLAAACGSGDSEAAPAAEAEPPPTFAAAPAPATPTLPPVVAEATSEAQIPNPVSVKAADKDDTITPAEAAQNVGKNTKICGTVEEIRTEPEIKEDPFLLNFDSTHPDVLFFALVRSAFQYRVGDWPKNPEDVLPGQEGVRVGGHTGVAEHPVHHRRTRLPATGGRVDPRPRANHVDHGNGACCAPSAGRDSVAAARSEGGFEVAANGSRDGMVRLGGSFLMGTRDRDQVSGDGEGPVREVHVSDFYVDVEAVTNADYRRFVDATGYVTEAERFRLVIRVPPLRLRRGGR